MCQAARPPTSRPRSSPQQWLTQPTAPQVARQHMQRGRMCSSRPLPPMKQVPMLPRCQQWVAGYSSSRIAKVFPAGVARHMFRVLFYSTGPAQLTLYPPAGQLSGPEAAMAPISEAATPHDAFDRYAIMCLFVLFVRGLYTPGCGICPQENIFWECSSVCCSVTDNHHEIEKTPKAANCMHSAKLHHSS